MFVVIAFIAGWLAALCVTEYAITRKVERQIKIVQSNFAAPYDVKIGTKLPLEKRAYIYAIELLQGIRLV